MAEEKTLSIYLIAGEASGDLLGAHLMRSLKNLSPRPLRFGGIGGDKMIAEGMSSLFPYHELSMLGFVEVLPHAHQIAARVNRAVEDILAKQPDVLVTIDSPGFCFRVAERLRKEKFQTKFIHYVAPTVWVYKPQRAQYCAKIFDHLLTLLPFEPPYFEKFGLPTTFIGHPVIAETQTGDGAAFRTKYEIDPAAPLFCLLPGSRKGEVKRHMPIFARAIGMLATRYPDLAIMVAVPKNMLGFIAPYFAGCPFRAVITANEQDKKDGIAASNFAIVKSGTVALEVAMAKTPMLVTYRVNRISAWALKRIMRTKYVNLINVLSGKEVIPELLQNLCNPLAIASAAEQMLRSQPLQEMQKKDAESALRQLWHSGMEKPSDAAARIILNSVS